MAVENGDMTGDAWATGDTCTLPTVERPLRIAEFDELFRFVREVERLAPTQLRLVLEETGGVADRARELTARETECCSFFDFGVAGDGAHVVVDVRVPGGRVEVLDGLAARAGAAPAGS